MTQTSKELTNDWKDKKLYDGLYYIRLKNGKTPIAELETWCRYDDEVEEPYKTSQEFFEYPKDIISEVLSPIPSYDEYKAMQEQLNKEGVWYTKISYKKIKKENNQLRDLLRECKRHLYFQKKINNEVITLLTRINSALGESEECAMTIKYELPYSAEIRAKHCEPDDEIDFGERYCTICGCVLNFDEEDICNDCLFESSRPLTGEEIKILEGKKNETR